MKTIMKSITDIDKKLYQTIFLYGVLSFGVIFLIAELFIFILNSLSTKITALTADVAAVTSDQLSSNVVPFIWLTLFLIVLFIVVEVYAYMFFENLIWNSIFNKKTTMQNTNKFLGLNIILLAIFVISLSIIFAAISQLQGSLIKIGVGIFYVAVAFAMYLIYIGYISFGKTHEVFRSVKNSFTIGLGKLKLTIIPFIVGIIIGAIINGVLLLFSFLPESVLTVVQGIAFAAYLAWFRIYLANTVKSVKF